MSSNLVYSCWSFSNGEVTNIRNDNWFLKGSVFVWLVDDHIMKLKMGLCSCPNWNFLTKVYMALVTRKQLPFDDGIWIIKQENKIKLELEFLAQLWNL